jgi:hypothetical protein
VPAPVLHEGATVFCAHGGEAQPTVPNPRVRVAGHPTVTMVTPYMVIGCPYGVSGVPLPCVSASWIAGATRVTSNGQPLLLIDSRALCAPHSTPLVIAHTQTRVTAI